MIPHESDLDAILRVPKRRSGLMATSCAGSLVHESYAVAKALRSLVSDCWGELRMAFSMHRDNMAYYSRFGGYCPDVRPLLECKDKIGKALGIVDYLMDEAEEIKASGWLYDMGHSGYVRELLGALSRIGYLE